MTGFLSDNVFGIHHIGYAVNSIEESLPLFSSMGFITGGVIRDEFRSVDVCLAVKRAVPDNLNCVIELLAPVRGKKGPLDGILSKMGNTPYHICYEVSDLVMVSQELFEQGFMVISSGAPSKPLGGMVCFLYAAAMGLIELIEAPDPIIL